jgi:hypothetical protein
MADNSTNTVSDPAPSVQNQQPTKAPIAAPQNGGKYHVDLMNYPPEVGSRSVLNHIHFYINVQADSKVTLDNSVEKSEIQPDRSAMNSIVGQPGNDADIKRNLTAATAAQGAVVAGGASLLSGNDLVTVGKDIVKGGVIGGATAIAQTAILSGAGLKFGQPAKRLKNAIVLYTPQQLSVRYGMQWSEEEIGIAAALATNPELANKLNAAGASMASGNVGDGMKQAGGAAAGVLASEILKKSPGMSAMTRSAGNPRKEQIFKGVDYRRFTFDYQFSPRDEDEAKAALNIIWLFKYHMHPEFKDATNFVYVYPSEFDIEYYIGGQQNTSLNKISSCVLTEMNVNYSPNGVFSTFPDGTPTQINMTLNFVELETLTKERIEAGL